MRLLGKKMAILLENEYEDLEFWYPLYRMKEEGVEVSIVAPEAEKNYMSKHGYPAKSDATPETIDIDKIDVLIIPGGYAPDRLRTHESVVSLVQGVHQNGGMIAAICHAGSLLVSADIVKGREVTSFVSVKDDLKAAGARWKDQDVVEDGQLITSRTPADLPAFMSAVVGRLIETSYRGERRGA